jgi:hypothetical protein
MSRTKGRIMVRAMGKPMDRTLSRAKVEPRFEQWAQQRLES